MYPVQASRTENSRFSRYRYFQKRWEHFLCFFIFPSIFFIRYLHRWVYEEALTMRIGDWRKRLRLWRFSIHAERLRPDPCLHGSTPWVTIPAQTPVICCIRYERAQIHMVRAGGASTWNSPSFLCAIHCGKFCFARRYCNFYTCLLPTSGDTFSDISFLCCSS